MTNAPTILAIDTATEQCSVAILTPVRNYERIVSTARGHAELILPLIAELLDESKLALSQLHGLAFGRGPGSFTGVRIAVGVIQGLAMATKLPVVGISNLAAVAQRVAQERSLERGERVLVCMDARMKEVYWGEYEVLATGLVELIGEEQVAAPESVKINPTAIRVVAGTALRAYPQLRIRYENLPCDDAALPRATEIAQLALRELQAGRGVDAAHAQPVYLRDQVAWPKPA